MIPTYYIVRAVKTFVNTEMQIYLIKIARGYMIKKEKG